jgi:hypothetical protein
MNGYFLLFSRLFSNVKGLLVLPSRHHLDLPSLRLRQEVLLKENNFLKPNN